MISVKLFTSPIKEKKYRAVFYKDGEIYKYTDFGANGMSDYTIHKDKERMKRYLARHRKNEDWNDPYSAGSLAKNVLWTYPDLKKAWIEYKKKFGFA